MGFLGQYRISLLHCLVDAVTSALSWSLLLCFLVLDFLFIHLFFLGGGVLLLLNYDITDSLITRSEMLSYPKRRKSTFILCAILNVHIVSLLTDEFAHHFYTNHYNASTNRTIYRVTLQFARVTVQFMKLPHPYRLIIQHTKQPYHFLSNCTI